MKFSRILYLCLALFAITPVLSPLRGQNGSVVADSLLHRALLDEGVSGRYDGDVAIFPRGDLKFDDLFHVIRQARHHVHIEYFIFADDSIAHALLDLLRAKAAEGIEVRLLIDDFKAVSRHYGFTAKRLSALRAEGIDVRMFDPFKFPYVNHIARDHRKIVVVDGRIGYIGGLNVSDYYIHGDPEGYGEWRDTHARIVGPAVEVLQRYFLQSFTTAGGASFEGVEYYPYTLSPADGDTVPVDYFQLPPSLPTRGITFVERSKERKAEMRRSFVAAFNSAQRKMLIVSPYFMPTASVRRALIRALDRGVEVQILLSAACDEPLLLYGNYNFARRLIHHGAQVYIYQGGFHHSKILMVDDSYSMVGSANLNSRSLRWDYEASCFIYSPEVTRRLTEIFEDDLTRSVPMTDSLYHSFSRRKRILGGVVNHLLTPIL